MSGALSFNEGMIHGGNGVRHIMYFLDYETMTDMPICGKTNCKHDSTNCDGFIDTLTWCSWDNHIYYIELGTEDTEDYLYSHCWLWKCNLDGTERERIIDLGRCEILYGWEINNIIYLGCSEECYPDEEPDELGAINCNCYFTEVDLETEEIRYTSENFTKLPAAEINVCGVYNNKLYSYIAYTNRETEDYTYPWYTYDLTTHEIEQYTAKDFYAIYSDGYVVRNTNSMIIEGNGICLDTEFNYERTHDFLKFGNYLYFRHQDTGRLYRVNLKTGEMTSSDKFDFSSDMYSLTYANEKYCVFDFDVSQFLKYTIDEMNFE